MALFGIWSQFGFRENPYSEKTLPADEQGDALLAGRDAVVLDLQTRIGSQGSHPSLEGPIGAGKTSLLNVASFRMTKHCLEMKAKELWLPATESFQPTTSVSDFESKVFQVIAQTLIEGESHFETVHLKRPDLTLIKRWVNDPEYTGREAGLTAGPIGANYGASSEPNTSKGFTESGFPRAVKKALNEAFPKDSGGIICIMDNLEILNSTGEARRVLEELRDSVFNIPQLRWVLCGSRGIVSRARSERLSGIFQSPVVLAQLSDESAVRAIEKRLLYFGNEGAIAPVTAEGFDSIYRAVNRNMRDSLGMSQDFAFWLASKIPAGAPLPPNKEREEMLNCWLKESAISHYENARRDVQKRHWKFLRDACSAGGRVASSEFSNFDFEHQQQMTGSVTSLAKVNLMVREADPDDGTRTINSVTSAGWLIYNFWSDLNILD